MSGDDLIRTAPEAAPGQAETAAPRVLCYVNHYFGPSPNFHGKSTFQSPEARRAIVLRCLASVRAAIPQAEIRVCGVPGRALVPLDLSFALSDPRELVYASLNHLADEVDRYDWFINLEDDIELPRRVFRNALEFERDSLPNECLLPNRLELHEGRLRSIDMVAAPGWTTQERRFAGRSIRVAVNPHSAILMLSQAKFRYALGHVDRSFRGPVVGGLMASAYAHFHRPLSLYRFFDEPELHAVVHLDPWAGPMPPGGELQFSAVLLSSKQTRNLPLAVRELRQMPQIDEILVWNNDPSRRLKLSGATVISAPHDFNRLARYGLVPLAKHDNIWFQDDDLLIRPRQFAALVAKYASDPSRITGCRGRNLRDGMYLPADAYGEVDVVQGQAMMFHRGLLKKAFAALGDLPPPALDDDIAFSLSCRRRHFAVNVEPIVSLETDRAAALCEPQPAARQQAAVDRYLAFLRLHPEPGEEVEAATQRAIALANEVSAVRTELERVRSAHLALAGSATVRAAGFMKRLPLLYPAWLRAKKLAQRD